MKIALQQVSPSWALLGLGVLVGHLLAEPAVVGLADLSPHLHQGSERPAALDPLLVNPLSFLPKIRCFSAVFQVQVKVQVKQGSQSSGFWGGNPPPAEIR